MDLVRRQFETNVFGPLQLARLVLPGMRRRGWGRIVNVSSMGGRITLPGGGAYHATKWALEALSDVLRYEVRGFGVDVIVVEPGIVLTRFGEAAADSVGPLASEGPYAAFDRAVASRTAAAYEGGGPVRLISGPPEAVAAVIERAAASRRPRTRYRVTPAARLLIGARRLLPDRLWDAALTTQYPQPGRDREP